PLPAALPSRASRAGAAWARGRGRRRSRRGPPRAPALRRGSHRTRGSRRDRSFPGRGLGHVDRLPRRREDLAERALERLERQRLVVRVEAVLVVLLAELGAVAEPFVAAEALAQVPVEPEVVEEVVALEDRVLLDDPAVLLGDERLENGRGELRVVRGRERVADVVEQGAHHVFVVAPVALGARGGLEAVRQPVHGVAAGVAGEDAQVGQDAAGQALEELEGVAADHLVVVARGVAHRGEAGVRGLHDGVLPGRRLFGHSSPGRRTMADTAPPLEVRVSRHFLSWLSESGASLAFTTYQTN